MEAQNFHRNLMWQFVTAAAWQGNLSVIAGLGGEVLKRCAPQVPVKGLEPEDTNVTCWQKTLLGEPSTIVTGGPDLTIKRTAHNVSRVRATWTRLSAWTGFAAQRSCGRSAWP